MAGKRNLLARCVLMAGSPTAAILLYRICYWHPYRKVEAGGELWVAKSRAEWMEETGLSLEQYKSAAATLQKRQLVVVQQRKYGTRTISFVRLSVRGQEVLSGSLPKAVEANDATQVEANDATGEVVNTPPGWGQMTPPYIMGDTVIGDTITEILQGEAFDLTEEKTNPLDTGKPAAYKPKGTEAPMVTIKQLQAQGGTAQKPKTLSTTVKKAKLEKVWLAALTQLTGKFAPALTAKDKGQLALIEKQCGDIAPTIITHAVQNWSAFVESVKASAGLHTVPALPKIGFLLSHASAAVMFHQQQDAEAYVPKVAVKAKTQAQVPTGPKKPSLDEVLQILSGDDDD